LYYTISF